MLLMQAVLYHPYVGQHEKTVGVSANSQNLLCSGFHVPLKWWVTSGIACVDAGGGKSVDVQMSIHIYIYIHSEKVVCTIRTHERWLLSWRHIFTHTSISKTGGTCKHEKPSWGHPSSQLVETPRRMKRISKNSNPSNVGKVKCDWLLFLIFYRSLGLGEGHVV